MPENRIDKMKVPVERRKIYFAGGPFDGCWSWEKANDSSGWRLVGGTNYRLQTITLHFGVHIVVGTAAGVDLGDWIAHCINAYCEKEI